MYNFFKYNNLPVLYKQKKQCTTKFKANINSEFYKIEPIQRFFQIFLMDLYIKPQILFCDYYNYY